MTETDYKKCYKFPYIASEIMAAEIPELIKCFFKEKFEDEDEISNKDSDEFHDA